MSRVVLPLLCSPAGAPLHRRRAPSVGVGFTPGQRRRLRCTGGQGRPGAAGSPPAVELITGRATDLFAAKPRSRNEKCQPLPSLPQPRWPFFLSCGRFSSLPCPPQPAGLPHLSGLRLSVPSAQYLLSTYYMQSPGPEVGKPLRHLTQSPRPGWPSPSPPPLAVSCLCGCWLVSVPVRPGSPILVGSRPVRVLHGGSWHGAQRTFRSR